MCMIKYYVAFLLELCSTLCTIILLNFHELCFTSHWSWRLLDIHFKRAELDSLNNLMTFCQQDTNLVLEHHITLIYSKIDCSFKESFDSTIQTVQGGKRLHETEHIYSRHAIRNIELYPDSLSYLYRWEYHYQHNLSISSNSRKTSVVWIQFLSDFYQVLSIFSSIPGQQRFRWAHRLSNSSFFLHFRKTC